jgi:hypothetical protein
MPMYPPKIPRNSNASLFIRMDDKSDVSPIASSGDDRFLITSRKRRPLTQP